jgi:2-keto-4-pentenoate hydratase/2-oxohepta-3-ene-1,7-dioic acid hydratase in catechol pathway
LKLLRIGPKGLEKPAVLDSTGKPRDVSTIVGDFGPETLGPALLDTLRGTDLTALPALDTGERIGAPLSRVGHFIAIGLNYADHAAETGAKAPEEPIIFSKAPSSLSGPYDEVMLPRGSKKTDWECELAVVIGTAAEYVSEAKALSHVFAYAICNDVSEREYQLERSGQWIKGKSAPTFGPLGPWMVTPDEIADPQNLDMFLEVNGKRAQTGNTSTMIFTIKTLISYLSQFMRLEPGDVITTGTPPGVGMGMKPQVYLKAGDEIHLGIAGLGEQRQKVIAHP